MKNNINIIWWWSIACEIARILSVNNIDITIITRNKEKTINLIWKKYLNVKIINYSETIEKKLPCIITVSYNESKIINDLKKKWEKIDRYCVKEKNTEVIIDIINYLECIEASTYFVLTNPVELIMLELIQHSKIDCFKVYGLWLDLDSKRFQIAIELMTGVIFKNKIVSTGLHINPIPIVNILEFNNKYSLNFIFNNLQKGFKYMYNYSNLDIYTEFKNITCKKYKKDILKNLLSYEDFYDLVKLFVNILIKSEFYNWKPPVIFPALSVAKTITKYIKWEYLNISYFNSWIIKWWVIKILDSWNLYKDVK